MKTFILGIIFLGLILTGCKKEEQIQNQKTIPVMNITDAESLIAVESSSISTANFYKITTDGSFEEITFINPDGSEIDSDQTETIINVNNIYNLSDNFILLTGYFSVWDTTGNMQTYQSILVRKSDGAIYNFGISDIDKFRCKLGESLFQKDFEGNLYFPDSNGMIHKLDISSPESIILSNYLSSGQTAEYFGIDRYKNCIYINAFSGVPNEQHMRIRKSNGGILDISKNDETPGDFWIGNNGDIYFTAHNYQNEGKVSINKLDQSNNLEVIEVWSASENIWDNYQGVISFHSNYMQGHYKIRKNNSIVFIDISEGRHWEYFENDNSVLNIDLPEIEEGCKIDYSNSFYYIATNTDLYKISLNNHTYEKLLNTGEYEVYSICVSSQDIVNISALRFLDGKKVFCEIDSNGNLTTIDEELNKEGIILERLN